MESIWLDQDLLLKSSSGLNRCGFESHTLFNLPIRIKVVQCSLTASEEGQYFHRQQIISGCRGARFISLALDARARRFESCHPDYRLLLIHRSPPNKHRRIELDFALQALR